MITHLCTAKKSGYFIGVLFALGMTTTSALAEELLPPDYFPVTSRTGFYLRAELGYQLLSNEDVEGTFNTPIVTNAIVQAQTPIVTLPALLIANQAKNEGLMQRVAVGYYFRHYITLESGFAWLYPFYRNYQGGTITASGATGSLGSVQTQTNLYAIDLLMSVTVPFHSFYSFFGGGIAYLHQQIPALVTPLNYSSGATVVSDELTLWPAANKAFVWPKFVIGVGYCFSSHWSVDASYAFYYRAGHESMPNQAYLPDLSIITGGVVYKF